MSKIEGTGAQAIAASALRAQQARMRVIAENIANSDSTGQTPRSEPYRRQVPVFSVSQTEDGGQGVAMRRVEADPAPFPKSYDPGHPAADAQGYVMLPNVNGLIEGLDMKAAQRAYEANLNMVENLDAMEKATLNILKR